MADDDFLHTCEETRDCTYATVLEMPKVKATSYLDAARLDAAIQSSGQFPTDSALNDFLAQTSQVGRWRTRGSVPNGDKLELLCYVLAATPADLFGRPTEEVHDYLIRTVAREMSHEQAEMLRMMDGMDADQRRRTVESVRPWAPPTVEETDVREPWELEGAPNAAPTRRAAELPKGKKKPRPGATPRPR